MHAVVLRYITVQLWELPALFYAYSEVAVHRDSMVL